MQCSRVSRAGQDSAQTSPRAELSAGMAEVYLRRRSTKFQPEVGSLFGPLHPGLLLQPRPVSGRLCTALEIKTRIAANDFDTTTTTDISKYYSRIPCVLCVVNVSANAGIPKVWCGHSGVRKLKNVMAVWSVFNKVFSKWFVHIRLCSR